MDTLKTNYSSLIEMKKIETILQCHDYNYSRIYQRFTRGMIRVQYDFRTNISDLSGEQSGMLIATKMILKNYDISALVEITDDKGIPRILFDNDFEEIKKRNDLVI